MRFFQSAVALSLLLLSFHSFALVAESDTQYGAYTRSEGISFSGDFVDSKNLDALLRYWNLGGGAEKSKDPSTGDWITGTFFSAGLGWEHHKHESFNLDGDYAKTPSEGLTTLAVTGEFGIKYNLPKPKKQLTQDEDDLDDDSLWFQPYLKPSLRVGIGDYSQTADYVQKKTSVYQDKVLGQRSIGASLAYSPMSLFSTKLGYNVYGYSKNVGNFTSTLNRNNISSARWAGLSSSLYDLNLWDSDLTLSIYPADMLDLRFYYKYGIAATDHTENWQAKALANFYIGEHFSIEPGYEHFYSSTMVDDLALLNISYIF